MKIKVGFVDQQLMMDHFHFLFFPADSVSLQNRGRISAQA